jgi:hypothetical protein
MEAEIQMLKKQADDEKVEKSKMQAEIEGLSLTLMAEMIDLRNMLEAKGKLYKRLLTIFPEESDAGSIHQSEAEREHQSQS